MARQLLDSKPFDVKEDELDLSIEADPDAVYTLRPLTTEEARRIVKAHTKQVFDRNTHKKVDETDAPAVHDALLEFVIAGWKGVGADGNAPCTLENKLKLPSAVQRALIDKAQVGDSAEVRAESFRQPA